VFSVSFFEKLDYIKIGTVTLNSLLSALVVFIVCFIVIKLLREVNRRALEKTTLDSGMRSFIASALKVVLWIIAALIICDCLNIPVTSLVAALSVAGLALSLSIQDILSNLFSGVTILGTRPFKGGDFVQVGDQSGTVCSVGLFHTVIRTADSKEVYVPNSKITSSDIINYSSVGRRRVDMTFCASYDSPTQLVRRAILEAVEDDSRILHDPAPFVAIKSYEASSVEYLCWVWTEVKDYWDVYYSLNESVRDSFAERGVVMPYSQLDVHVVTPRPEARHKKR
jgi:small conductance mechanosensitive channel